MKWLCFALSWLPMVLAVAPPHPDFADEYHNDERRNLKSLQYELPANMKVDPQFCNDLSESDCRRLNNAFSRSAEDTLNVISTTRKLRPLVILVQFTDHTDRTLPTRYEIDRLFNSDEISSELPTGSVKRYLEHNSYQQLSVESTVVDWLMTDNTEQHYSFGESGLNPELEHALTPVMNRLDWMGYDFSQHDMNGDRFIDSVMFLHSGYPAEIGGKDCTNGREYMERIWAHAIVELNQHWISNAGYKVGTYTVASALSGTCQSNRANLGVITHELIHTWGIPDIYDTAGDFVGKGTGLYSIMSNPYGSNRRQLYPSSLGPWEKMASGWLSPIDITQDGLYTIEASSGSYPNIFRIRQGYPEGEYLLIENRQPGVWDADLGGGLLIWHVDESKFGNEDRGYPGQPGWPGNGKHYKVSVVQADGKFDLETGANAGDPADFWVKGSRFTPGPVDTVAADFSQYPNTNSYQNGNIRQTGIYIYEISESSAVMTFKIGGFGGNPIPDAAATHSPVPPQQQQQGQVPSQQQNPFPAATYDYSSVQVPSSQQLPVQVPSQEQRGPPTFPPINLQVPSSPAPVRWATPEPTPGPTAWPTRSPIRQPTPRPSMWPTKWPTARPTNWPTLFPTPPPTPGPTPAPTRSRTREKLPTLPPTPIPQPFPIPTPAPTPLNASEEAAVMALLANAVPAPTVQPDFSSVVYGTNAPSRMPVVYSTVKPDFSAVVYGTYAPSTSPATLTEPDSSAVEYGTTSPTTANWKDLFEFYQAYEKERGSTR